MNQSRYDEAVMHGRYAVSFLAKYTDAFINLSDALRNLGHIDEARKAIEQAVILSPDSPEVHMDLADVLLMEDKYAEAEVSLKKVDELKPDNARVYIKLAGVQERANKVEEAFETIEKAVKLNPEMPEVYVRKAHICHVANMAKDAEENYLKALEIIPNAPSIFLALADLYISLGDLKKANSYVKKAKKITLNLPSMYYTLAQLKTYKKSDPDFKKMLELEKGISSRGLDESAVLHFSLFHAYEDIKDYKKAFEHLKSGNDLKRQLVPYQSNHQKDGFNRTKKRFSKKNLKNFKNKGYKSDVPVFILGMPRSGTTLTEQIISSHPDVIGAGELSIMATLERNKGTLNDDNCTELGLHYVKELKKLDPTGKAKRITDKMPGNFSNIGIITSILPNAKIIHCRRNPIDTSLSCYKQNFARGQYWSYNLEEMAEQYKLYLDLMSYWRKVLPGRFLEIDYEETVNNFEEQARKLIDYVDLPWDKACLKPHKQKRSVMTASKSQVIKPVYKTSVKAWHRYKKQLEPLIKGLEGIEETSSSKSKKKMKSTTSKKKSAKKLASKKTKATKSASRKAATKKPKTIKKAKAVKSKKQKTKKSSKTATRKQSRKSKKTKK